MRKFLLLLTTLLPMVASAYDAYIDGIYYDFYEDEATVASGDTKYNGDVVIPTSVTYEGKTYSLTSIGVGAFRNCYGLTSVTFSNSVTSIRSEAFSGCSGLRSVTIGNSVTDIGYQAFYSCSGLTSVTIPASVTDIGGQAFAYCSGLKSVHITDLAAWCKISFLTRDSNPLSYAKHLFLNGEEMTDLVIPNSVTSIGWYAFWGYSDLTSLTIPSSVTSIGAYAFENCRGLTSLTIPNSVTDIGYYAFSGCSGLTSLTIPNSVTAIGYLAFQGCSGLTSISVENGNTVYDSRDNCNAIVETANNSLIAGCKNTVIPNSVTSIGDYAFYGCSLTSMTIPNSVTSIGDYAFSGCI